MIEIMGPLQSLLFKIDHEGLWQKEFNLKRNEFLTIQDRIDTNLYLILEGTLCIYIMDNDVKQIVRFGYRGDLITALDCFLSDKPTLFNIQTLKKTHLKVLSRSSFLEFVNSDNEVKDTWTQVLQSFVHQQIEREFDLLTSSPMKRYQRVLKRSPKLFQEIPHKYIASYLRMAPETLSRIKKR